ncbi:MAG TPA: 2-C-methyl-D-erythritol 2,4-cyclodiphosphate synthase [Firmicutes bacterium]|nr:2-C-methyl-D-erythritol 2,4-cyclodiphosphate synthase [Bacillota bacterium]
MIRAGIGFDVHRLEEGRELWLGGIKIPYHKGLMGHSDADVLLHALADSLLGAAAMPDLGQLFPDTDPKYEGISSLELLSNVWARIRSSGYRVLNVDMVIIAEEPRIAPYIGDMKKKIAGVLQVSQDQVGIKAKTAEKLGAIGDLRGIEAYAVCVLESA